MLVVFDPRGRPGASNLRFGSLLKPERVENGAHEFDRLLPAPDELRPMLGDEVGETSTALELPPERSVRNGEPVGVLSALDEII